MAVRAGGGRERYYARSGPSTGTSSLVPAYPYPGSSLDAAFVANAYTWGRNSLDANFESTAAGAYFYQPSVAMPSYSNLPGFITGIGGTFTRASTATYFDNTGTLQTAASGVPRIGQLPGLTTRMGYLAEEARTNSLPNNTATGAVAGSPGTLPTGVFTGFTANQGTAVASVAAVGVESGISYWDVTIAGVTTGVGSLSILFCASTAVTAASGETWAASVYTRLTGGTAAFISGASLFIVEYTAAGAFVAGGSGAVNLAASTLPAGRSTHVRTLSGGGTVARVQSTLNISYTAGAVNATYRIGLPQLELGAFATSPIPTTTVAVARAADVLSLPTTGWYSASAGTWFIEFTPLTALGADATLFSANDVTANNRFGAGVSALAAGVYNRVRSGGANYDSAAIVSALTPGTAYRTASAASVAGGGSNVLSGGTVSTATVTAMPLNVAALEIGCELSAAFANCLIHRIFYIPSREANATLQSITA